VPPIRLFKSGLVRVDVAAESLVQAQPTEPMRRTHRPHGPIFLDRSGEVRLALSAHARDDRIA